MTTPTRPGAPPAADWHNRGVTYSVPPQPCRVDVDLGAVEHNARILTRAAHGARVMAVVKADAYGHGAVPVSMAALRGGADALGVTTIAEAVGLREAGIDAEVLAWLYAPGDDVGVALARDIDLAVAGPEHLDAVLAAARATGRRARITVKLDTGMHRSGVTSEQWPTVLDRLVAADGEGLVEVTGLMAHFSHADEPDGSEITDAQAGRLHQYIAHARRHGLDCPVNHHANSAATLTRGHDDFQMVRPGIALYGLSPVEDDHGLIPAMTFSTAVLMVKDLARGEGASYGHTWHAPRDTVVALVAAGYADGVWRTMSGRFEVSIRGRRFPAVGRVCMDQFLVDLGPRDRDGRVPHGVAPGDTAVLFGDGADGGPTAAEWADLVGSIHYEVVTAVRGRAVRSHHQPIRVRSAGAAGEEIR